MLVAAIWSQHGVKMSLQEKKEIRKPLAKTDSWKSEV